MVVVVVVMVMVMLHRRGGQGSGRSGFLRDGIAGESDGERSCCDKALDHERQVLWKKAPSGLDGKISRFRLNAR